MTNANILSPVKDFLKVCFAVAIIGVIALAIIFSILFALGFVVGCAFCIADMWLLAFMVSCLLSDNTKPKYILLFSGKTIILLLALGVIVFVLSRFCRPMLWGFISGLFIIPVSGVVYLIVRLIKGKRGSDTTAENK